MAEYMIPERKSGLKELPVALHYNTALMVSKPWMSFMSNEAHAKW